MVVAVLGANGFIGKNIVEYFGAKVHYKVLAPKRVELDLLDTKAVEEYFKEHTPDFVVHSAVNIHSLEQNLQIYFNIERCAKYYKKLITIGSGAEYDMRHYVPMMREDYFSTFIPADTYGLSKYVASKDIECSEKNSVNLRVLGIFGKYEDYSRRFISNNICKALCGDTISLYQNMKFDFLYIKDFLRILEFFLNHEVKYKNYNVCTSRPVELLELAKIIHAVHGDENIKIVVKEEGMKPEYSADNSRLLAEMGEFEFTEFDTAISELYTWYRTSVDLTNFCQTLQG